MEAPRKRLRFDADDLSDEETFGLDSTQPSALSGIPQDHEPQKDEDELRLERILFGKLSAPKVKPRKKEIGDSPDAEQYVTTGLENVRDEDLFVMDDLVTPVTDLLGDEEDEIPQMSESSVESDDESESNGPQDSTSAYPPRPTYEIPKIKSAWADPSDDNIKISLAADTRLYKLRDSLADDEVTGRIYEAKLRRQFERMNPTPEWATNARGKLHQKRKRLSSLDGAEDEHEELEHLLRSTSGILNTSAKASALPSDSLKIEHLRDANSAARSYASILSVRFHPSPTVSVMLSTGMDNRLRLFNIDGLMNPLLHTVHATELRKPRAIFHPTGSSILLTAERPYYYVYDIQSDRFVKSSSAFWKSTTSRGRILQDRVVDSFSMSKFSPDGKFLAVGGRDGYVYLVDWSQNITGGPVTGSMKMNTDIKDLCWVGQDQLMTLGDNSEVYLWDIGMRRCISRWRDEGTYKPNILEGSTKGDYYAVGTHTGIVSVYDRSAVRQDSMGRSVNPLKEITNLKTSITSMRIDPSSQLIAAASDDKECQLKMIHLPSLKVFANWPTPMAIHGSVTALDFSPGTEYFAVGNDKGRVMLYSLKHFAV
ncbi:WD40-repeat-containing domain protein [Cantharellus anzutake]|uniref:WD40-repeat-containing domain protein n=1 Tax=Cantharellus anzutake TaxID=1750568 RepID=UPI0019034454|nr:WD40-repeat-containing domain protein [Cantharellus anzutake]KAF8330328.1 WD40-repeat-containing domain protein [Cantharellus anzutake]